jgi:acetylornithine/N-succinyldiaminopimelate aminotransferase
MKEPATQFDTVKKLFDSYVLPTYMRFDIAFSHGLGNYVWDLAGKRYLDLGGGIAVNVLGHSNPDITQALLEQSQRLIHTSNLYYNELQGRLACRISSMLAPGKVFFSNSGGEANEGLFKLARKFGHDEGRFEIITAHNSFHGRTLAGIAATGQDKVKKGFEPLMPGFRHVPFNDLDAMRAALSPATVAILIEGIQGEGGVMPATPEYLLGLRSLCDEKRMLLLMDGVQDGHFRTGRFHSFQTLLDGHTGGDRFLPDAISMAKSLGGGFPIGAFWVRDEHAALLGPGSHATTFGGTPLACAVALRILDVIQRDNLAENTSRIGSFIKTELTRVAQKFPQVIKQVRGCGLMVGFELAGGIAGFGSSSKASSLQFVNRLHDAGVLTVPSGTQVVRLLPALNITQEHAREGLEAIEQLAGELAR